MKRVLNENIPLTTCMRLSYQKSNGESLWDGESIFNKSFATQRKFFFRVELKEEFNSLIILEDIIDQTA